MTDRLRDGAHAAEDSAQEATLSMIECFERIKQSSVPGLDTLPADHALIGELRRSVGAYVSAVRAFDPPETAIVHIKQIMHDHAPIEPAAYRALSEATIRAVVDAYYA